MSLDLTLAAQLRDCVGLLDRLAPSSKNPHKYHEDKSEIRSQLSQVADLLEGKFRIEGPEPKPKKAARKPAAPKTKIEGNVIRPDFTAARKIGPDQGQA